MAGGFGGAGGFTNDAEFTDSPSTTKKTGVFAFAYISIAVVKNCFLGRTPTSKYRSCGASHAERLQRC